LLTPSPDFRRVLNCYWLKAKKPSNSWLQRPDPHGRRQLTRVNSTNVLDEGLRIGGSGRRMNSKVKVSRNKCISKVNVGVQPGLLSICPAPSPPGPNIKVARSRGSGRVRYRLQYRHTVRTRIRLSLQLGLA
jgi:hypothetical protein